MAAEGTVHDGGAATEASQQRNPREARDRARIRGARQTSPPPSDRPGPARQPNLLSDQDRHAPLLRANPNSEVTNPICRLPLPTLIYRLEALYLGDLLRIRVQTGATTPRGPLLDFQGPRRRSGHRRNCGALGVPNPISLLEVSRQLERLYRKENSSRIS